MILSHNKCAESIVSYSLQKLSENSLKWLFWGVALMRDWLVTYWVWKVSIIVILLKTNYKINEQNAEHPKSPFLEFQPDRHRFEVKPCIPEQTHSIKPGCWSVEQS